MNYYLSPLLILLGLVIYQVSQKSADQNANPFLVIILAYVFGIIGLLAAYFVFPRPDGELIPMVKSVAWASLGIGVGAAIIEIGFLLAYRAGWNVSILPLTVNVASAVLLIAIGLYYFRESLSLQRVIGILLCLGGLALITLRK